MTMGLSGAAPRHPFTLRLVQALLARADRSRPGGPCRLPLDERVAPELHTAGSAEELELLHMQLDDLCRCGWVALRLDAARPFATFVDRRPRLELVDFDALCAWAGYVPKAQRWQQQWREHLSRHWAEQPASAPADVQAVLDYLARSPLGPLEGMPLDEATESLCALTRLCRAGPPIALREASARVFQGRSKLLDHRDELLRLLGAAPGRFFESPIQLLLAAPARADGFGQVLFIENLATFEHMADCRGTEWEESLLIYAAGFRGSARRLRTRAGCRLYLRAPPDTAALDTIEAWLFQPDATAVAVRFFGDLDYAGMQILCSLREVFPQAEAWRPGYAQLARLLAGGGGHAPESAAKELQVDPGSTGCAYADDKLLPLLRELARFVDQEAFDPAQACRSD